MATETGFSISKLPTYSTEEILKQQETFRARASRLQSLSSAYNGKVSEALNENVAPIQQLANSRHWSNLRDVATEMAADATKKATACQVELDFRG